jgi:hypothetical protein
MKKTVRAWVVVTDCGLDSAWAIESASYRRKQSIGAYVYRPEYYDIKVVAGTITYDDGKAKGGK